jgi:hypothetical protein
VKIIRDRLRTVDVEDFLARPLFAHLSTASGGGPRDSPVWFMWEEGALWIIGSRSTDSFPMRLELEPRCAIGIVDFDRTTGLVQHIGLRGRATVEPFDVARARRLLSRYLGSDEAAWDERFLRTLRNEDGEIFVRFDPETVVARDVSYSTGAASGRASS